VRKAERIIVNEAARLHPNDWSSLEVRLLDCSEGGFRACCQARVGIGDAVTLELPGLDPARARVTWCHGKEFGARFDAPFPLERANLTLAGDDVLLARLLVERAAAHRANLHEREQMLRERIRQALPVRRDQKIPEGP